MRRTILGLLAFALPLIGAPMGVKAEELNATVPQSAISTVVNNTLSTTTAPSRRLSTQLAELRAMREAAETRNAGEVQQVAQPVNPPVQQALPGPPPVISTITPAPVVNAPQQEQVASDPNPGIVLPPRDSIPQQGTGEWKPVRLHTEFRSRPRDTAFDVKAELVTKGGWIFGVQYVNQSGTFSGENLKEIWKGTYRDTRSEFWAGRHGASKDGRTRWSVNGFVRRLTHEDSGEGKSLPGAEYPYSYTWKNSPKPITQLGVRARVERDLIRTESQQLTVHLKGEAAATVSGQSGWAYDVQAGVWYRTAQVEAYGEVGVNNTGAYANGYGRYYLTKSGQVRPFVEVRGEVGSGYHNTQVGGGLQIGIGKHAYAEGVLGYNAGTSGNGLAATARFGFRFYTNSPLEVGS